VAGTTTILFTDVTDSSGLVHRLGDERAAAAVAAHLRLLRGEVERCHGKVTKTLGDGLMAVFSTAYHGALAATAMQQAAELANRKGESPVLGLRVGMHVGDVVDDGADDVFGAAVVVARRLCDAATSGKILASDLVRSLVGNRPDIRFAPLDAFELKGIPEPVVAAGILWTPLPEQAPIRVIVADDAALIRAGVVRLLADEGFDVVAEASDYTSLTSAIDRDPPDLVITDIRMPPGNRDEGLRAASYVKANHPGVAVLILSQYVEASAAAGLLDGQTAGVGYLLKERVSELDAFIRAARTIAGGGSLIDPLVTDQLLSKRRANDRVASLSDRESEILALMAQGLSNQAISAELFLSAKTVETHVRSIFNKLGLPEDVDGNRRVQAVIRWLEADRPTR
jgi:DNA-binding NarL/FixJ family response regulator/class 3 adenylate cyclase